MRRRPPRATRRTSPPRTEPLSQDFRRSFFSALLEATHRFEPGVGSGADESVQWRDGVRSRVRDAVLAGASRAGLHRPGFAAEQSAPLLAEVSEQLDPLGEAWALLGDEHSRRTLIEVLVLRVLGPRHSRPRLSSREFWRRCRDVERARGPDGALTARTGGGEEVRLHGHPMQVVEFFELEQYAYRHGVTVEADVGDVVIDGGGGWGETALYFADRVGEHGRVLVAEFEPGNLGRLEANLAANEHLRRRIEVVRRALWEGGEPSVRVAADGLSSSVAEGGSEEVAAISIDELCQEQALERLDFVKLDVEGAELAALRGAERSLRRFRPKLAVSAYHRSEDLFELPLWLDSLGLGYELYLDHFSPGWNETVLFARPGKN